MDAIGIGSIILGFVLSAVGNIWIIILAFKRHIGWGIGTLLLPFVGFVFVCMNWNSAGRPFLLYLLSIAFVVGGYFMSPTMQKNMAESSARTGSP